MKACAHFEGELALTLDTEDKKNWKLELHCGQRAATFTAASHEDYPDAREYSLASGYIPMQSPLAPKRASHGGRDGAREESEE